MLKELALYWKLRPDLKALRGLTTMRLSVNVIGQALLILLHIGNVAAPAVQDGHAKFYIAAGIGLLQWALSLAAHFSNPDGTPVTEPYGLTDKQIEEYRRIFSSAAKAIVIALILTGSHAIGQATPTPSPIKWLPQDVYSAGAGYVKPGGKFGLGFQSHLVGRETYATVAVEYTALHGLVQSYTMAGITRPLWQFGPFTVCATGLGGGYTGTDGRSGAAAAAQACLDVRIKKTAWGVTLTGQKLSNAGGWKATISPRWAQ